MRLFLFCAAVVVVAGCSPFGPDDKEFVIKADSVVAPSAVSVSVPFTARFYGFVGRNLCWHFKEFRVDHPSGAADITIIGINGEDGRLCAQAISFMEGEPLTITPSASGPFLLRIHQPDGTTLTRTIQVE